MSEARNTRERIQAIAMELFSEQGYEHTSLREIAERMDVSKAALYYHFKTKEDIVASFVTDYVDEVDAMCDWGESQPPGIETGAELIRRYAKVLHDHRSVLLFMHRNQAALRRQQRETLLKSRMRRLLAILVSPDAPLLQRLRATNAVMGMHTAWFMPMGEQADAEELSAATIRIAIEILELNDAELAEANGCHGA